MMILILVDREPTYGSALLMSPAQANGDAHLQPYGSDVSQPRHLEDRVGNYSDLAGPGASHGQRLAANRRGTVEYLIDVHILSQGVLDERRRCSLP